MGEKVKKIIYDFVSYIYSSTSHIYYMYIINKYLYNAYITKPKNELLNMFTWGYR